MMQPNKWKPFPRAILATAFAAQLLLASCVSRQAGQASVTGRVPSDAKAESPYGSVKAESFAEYIRTVFRVSQKSDRDGLEPEADLLKENPRLAELAERASADPSDLRTRFELARCFEEAGATGSAFQQYEEVLRIDPKNASALYGIARIWYAWGDSVESLRAATEALVHDPDQSGASELIGRIYLGRNQPELALAAFERGLSRDRTNARLTAGAGIAWERMGRDDRARQLLESALSVDPSLMEARRELGALLARQGLLADAYMHLRQVEGDAMALFRLGSILLTAGRTQQARTAFREALAKDAGLEEARMQLSRVEAQMLPPTVVQLPSFTGQESTTQMAALPAPRRFQSDKFTVVGGLQVADARRQTSRQVDLSTLAASASHAVELSLPARELGSTILSPANDLGEQVFHNSSTTVSQGIDSPKLAAIEPLPSVVTLPSFQPAGLEVSISEPRGQVAIAEIEHAEASAPTHATPGEIAAEVSLDASSHAVAEVLLDSRDSNLPDALSLTPIASQDSGDSRRESTTLLPVQLANLNGNLLKLPLQLRMDGIRAVAALEIVEPAESAGRQSVGPGAAPPAFSESAARPAEFAKKLETSEDVEAAVALAAGTPADPDALAGEQAVVSQTGKASGSGSWMPKWSMLHSPWTLQLVAFLFMLLSALTALGMRRRRESRS